MTADHGESLGSHGGLANKGVQPFEETIKIPLVMAGPGIQPDMTCDNLVSNLDLHETICEWQGALPVNDLQSRSLATLCNPSQTSPINAEAPLQLARLLGYRKPWYRWIFMYSTRVTMATVELLLVCRVPRNVI